VFSGYNHDARNPGYFCDLTRKISQWGMREEVIYLGTIPYEHVFLLMRQSAFVLNPSSFEGYGMTANEAGMLGKKILLSDIPAHREQSLPEVTFFNLHDPQDLREKIMYMWNQTQPGPDSQLECRARNLMPQRLRECAQSFAAIAYEVTGKKI
jgi:glycosyltransferase involved in cell wall biosynthesis